ncbi:hypothetical protein CsatB_002080 [Cannabis sativa]|uniref:F-box protein AUF2 n=1 Tax=Cannabis sativa TaxID=3483 RepID=UPI0029C9E15B|nr:F-box protein AUF2 [Cannabis sativa]
MKFSRENHMGKEKTIQEEEEKDYIDQLPDEILLTIFNKILDAKSLIQCRTISKRFNSLIPQIDSIYLNLSHRKIPQKKPFFNIPKSIRFLQSIISPNKTKSRLNNNTRNILHYQPEEALKNFNHVKSLNLEIPSSEEKNDKSFLKWAAEFGTSLKSCVIIGANSISKNDNENSQSRIESQPLILSDEELKLRIVWMISSLMAASSRHYMLKRIVVDFPTISNVVVSDEEKRGKVYMGAEQLSELRLNSVNDEFKLSLERSVIPDLRMKVWYVPKLELGCGLVMSGATLVVIRPMVSGDQAQAQAHDDNDVFRNGFDYENDEEKKIVGEAIGEMIKMKKTYVMEMTSF